MLNPNSIMIGSDNPKVLGDFYKKIAQKDPDWAEDVWQGFKIGDTFLTIGPHSEVKGKNKEPGRLLFNFETKEVNEEFERIKKLGAKVITKLYHPDEAHEMTIATFADPDGNYFQLMSPMNDK